MATFNFGEANGTNLETIDSKWEGNTTLLNAQSGLLQVTATGGGTPRVAWYSNGQSGTQQVQAVFKASSASPRLCVHTQMSATATSGWGYEARATGTNTIELRRNSTYVTEGSISGGNFATTDYVIKMRSNSSTGAVTVWAAAAGSADAEVSGSQIVTTTDGSPITGGFPGLQEVATTAVTDAQLDDWTDFESSGATYSRGLALLGVG